MSKLFSEPILTFKCQEIVKSKVKVTLSARGFAVPYPFSISRG